MAGGYSTSHGAQGNLKIYRRGLDLLIHKDPNEFIPHHLRPILIFCIEANIRKKHMERTEMIKSQELDALAPEQYGIRKAKESDIQELNTCLF